MSMQHPYKEHGDDFVADVLEGGRHEVRATRGTLSERLRQYAYYMTEQQKTSGDALLVIDLHDAVKALEKIGR